MEGMSLKGIMAPCLLSDILSLLSDCQRVNRPLRGSPTIMYYNVLDLKHGAKQTFLLIHYLKQCVMITEG